MLSIDDARAGRHKPEFNSAMRRFCEMHRTESFFVSASDMGQDGFGLIVGIHGKSRAYPLIVQVGDDPEQAILTALEAWWVGHRRRKAAAAHG